MAQRNTGTFIPQEWLLASQQNKGIEDKSTNNSLGNETTTCWPTNFGYRDNSSGNRTDQSSFYIRNPKKHKSRNIQRHIWVEQQKHFQHTGTEKKVKYNTSNKNICSTSYTPATQHYYNGNFIRKAPQQRQSYFNKYNSYRKISSSSDQMSSKSDINENQCSSSYTAKRPNRFSLNREWKRVSSCSERLNMLQSDYTIELTIVSYNILSQTLLHSNQGLYYKSSSDILEWDYRWTKLKDEIKSISADIFCFQEIEDCHYKKQIKPFLQKLGYSCFYKKRTSDSLSKPDGVLTAFKSSCFTLFHLKEVEYNRPEIKKYFPTQENVGLILCLKVNLPPHIQQECLLLLANTHLLYNPRRGDIKLLQAVILMTELHSTLQELENCDVSVPIFICGDFNSTPYSPLYNFITSSSLNYEGLTSKLISGQKCKNKNGGTLQCPFIPKELKINDKCIYIKDDNEEHGGEPVIYHSLGRFKSAQGKHEIKEATTTQDNGITVDFIFYSNETDIENKDKQIESNRTVKTELIGKLGLVNGKAINDACGLPNPEHPSDHLPVISKFLLHIPYI